MKRLVFIVVLMIIFGAVATILATRPKTTTKRSTTMELSSSAFTANEAIPARYTCQGDNINPPLTMLGTPNEAVSLALVVDDPDAPGGTFDHWVIWNLPKSLVEIPENWSIEKDVSVGANGMGDAKYMGPCPPSGTHHYHFKLYALNERLDLAAGSTKAELEAAMTGHIIDQTELVGTYSKH